MLEEFISNSSKIPPELELLAKEARKYKSADEFVGVISKPRKEGDASRTPADVIKIREESGTLADYRWREAGQWFGEYTDYETPVPQSRVLKFKIYRAVPLEAPNYILPGDYVTQSRKYAQMHLDFVLQGKGKIIQSTATMDDITPINPNEFWYVPKAMEQFKDLKLFWQIAQKEKGHLT